MLSGRSGCAQRKRSCLPTLSTPSRPMLLIEKQISPDTPEKSNRKTIVNCECCLDKATRPCKTLGDFCQSSYRLACLFARLLRRVVGRIARLCSRQRSLKANEHPTQFDTRFSGNRLSVPDLSMFLADSGRSPSRTSDASFDTLDALSNRPKQRQGRLVGLSLLGEVLAADYAQAWRLRQPSAPSIRADG